MGAGADVQGALYLSTLGYLTLLVAFVVSLLEEGPGGALLRQTLRRWGKFLLGLVVLGAIVQVLSLL